MAGNDPRSVEAKITRLTREIAEIDDFFYTGKQDEDRSLYAGMPSENEMTLFDLRSCKYTRQLKMS